MNTDKGSLTQSGPLYRIQIAVSPLRPREIPLVLEAFSRRWARPEDVGKAHNPEAVVLIASAEGHLQVGECPEEVARGISYAIWRALDRYVKVTVEATYLGENPHGSFEFGEKAYAQAYGTRFES